MQKRLASVALLVIVLLLLAVPMASAQTTTVPPKCDDSATACSTTMTGTWDPTACGGRIVQARDATNSVLGFDTVSPVDGTWTITFNRTLVVGDTISLWTDCGSPDVFYQMPDCAPIVVVACPPVPIPEPGSILLLGTGLAGLAGYAGLRWRSRK